MLSGTPRRKTVQTLSCEIASIEKLNHDVYQVALRAPTAELGYTAGQYLDLVLTDGRKASFSIGSAPEAGEMLELHIRHNPDSDMSNAILEHLKTESSIAVELPKGNCCLAAEDLAADTTLIFAAASTGFSQVKSMVEHLLASGVKNPIHVYWGARVVSDLYWSLLPEQWAAEHDNVVYHPVISEPSPECGWAGRTDLLPDAIGQDFDSFDKVAVYTSGSPAMVYALLDACEARGMSEAQMHSDVFAYAPRPSK